MKSVIYTEYVKDRETEELVSLSNNMLKRGLATAEKAITEQNPYKLASAVSDLRQASSLLDCLDSKINKTE